MTAPSGRGSETELSRDRKGAVSLVAPPVGQSREHKLYDMGQRLSAFLLFAAVLSVAQTQPFTVDAMMKLARISEPQLSPDGTLVAFTVQTVNLESNTKPKQIYVVPLAGGAPVS